MTEEVSVLPLPPTEIIQNIHQFEFLQSALSSKSSTVSSFKAITYLLSSTQLINGWEQQQEKVNRLQIDDAFKLMNGVHMMITGAKQLTNTNDQEDDNVELIRLRYDHDKELFVLPDFTKDLCIVAVVTRLET